MPSGAGTSSAPASAEVLEMAEPSKTEQRKAEHVNIILQENVSAEYNYWNDVRLVHTALPEIDLDDVDVSVKFFGKRLEAPLIISSMTGGFGMGKEINANLAKAAAEVGVARSEEHTSELQSPCNLVCRLLLEKKKNNTRT